MWLDENYHQSDIFVTVTLIVSIGLQKIAFWTDLIYPKTGVKHKSEYLEVIGIRTKILSFCSSCQLQQGASVLYAITSNLVGDKLLSKTLDMEGRTQAVQLMQNMADSFDTINVPDPNKLKPFIETITGSVMAILEVTKMVGGRSLTRWREYLLNIFCIYNNESLPNSIKILPK